MTSIDYLAVDGQYFLAVNSFYEVFLLLTLVGVVVINSVSQEWYKASPALISFLSPDITYGFVVEFYLAVAYLLQEQFVGVTAIVGSHSVNDFLHLLQPLLFEEGVENFLSFSLFFPVFASQNALYLTSCLCCGYVIKPFWLYMLCRGGHYLYLVAASQFVTKWYEYMVYLCPDAVCAEHGVYGECEIECCGVQRHRFEFSFWCEHHDFTGKEVEFDIVEEIERVGLWIVEYFLDGI